MADQRLKESNGVLYAPVHLATFFELLKLQASSSQ